MATGYRQMVKFHFIEARAETHITLPVIFDFKTFPASLSTCLITCHCKPLCICCGFFFHSHYPILSPEAPNLRTPDSCLSETHRLWAVFGYLDWFDHYGSHRSVNDETMYWFWSLNYCKLPRTCIVGDPGHFKAIGSANEAITVDFDELVTVSKSSLSAEYGSHIFFFPLPYTKVSVVSPKSQSFFGIVCPDDPGNCRCSTPKARCYWGA